MKVTGEEVKAAMIAAGIACVDHHDCSFCGYTTGYFRDGANLYFDPGCSCTPGAKPELRDWNDAADWINMQSDPAWRDRIAERFGLGSKSLQGDK